MSVPSASVLVVGAGTSALVLDLVAAGDRRVIASDISPAALAALRIQLAQRADSVEYVVGDVRTLSLAGPVDLWHDRAVMHFLTSEADQRAYAERAAATVRPGGHLLVAGFAEDGPEQCSGLPVARHSIESLRSLFGEDFDVTESFESGHVTPWNSTQLFRHTVFTRRMD